MREALDHWTFVIASYAIALGGTALLIASSWLSMRRAEHRRDKAREQ
jgi:hypothetical protein